MFRQMQLVRHRYVHAMQYLNYTLFVMHISIRFFRGIIQFINYQISFAE